LCCGSDLIDDSRPHLLELGVDDSIQQPHWRHRLRMPRSLLAVVVVQLLLLRDEGEREVCDCFLWLLRSSSVCFKKAQYLFLKHGSSGQQPEQVLVLSNLHRGRFATH
jgi:hypothetical protein